MELTDRAVQVQDLREHLAHDRVGLGVREGEEGDGAGAQPGLVVLLQHLVLGDALLGLAVEAEAQHVGAVEDNAVGPVVVVGWRE